MLFEKYVERIIQSVRWVVIIGLVAIAMIQNPYPRSAAPQLRQICNMLQRSR
jgi:hypothetical protein